VTRPILIEVKVKPNARASVLEQSTDGEWLAQVKAPPVDGKANRELIALVAQRFGCPKSAVSIKTGASGRTKLVRIDPGRGGKMAR
jgi:uncharacterized protein (TIGR00251 family)